MVRRRAVWIASGITAAYAVQLAVDRPELARALVLVCPLGIDSASEEPDLKDAVIHRLLRLPVFGNSALNVLSSRRGIEHHLRREVFSDPDRVTPERVDHYWRSAHDAGSRAALAAYLSGYLNHSVAGALERLRAPALLVWGSRAVQPGIASADLWLRACAEAELERIDGAGVQPQVELPQRFADAVARFHRELPPA